MTRFMLGGCSRTGWKYQRCDEAGRAVVTPAAFIDSAKEGIVEDLAAHPRGG